MPSEFEMYFLCAFVLFFCLCCIFGANEKHSQKKSQWWKELCLVSKGKIDMRKWFVAKCFNSNHSNNLNNFVFLRIRQIQFGTNWMSLNSWCIQCWRPVKFLLGFYDRFYKFNKNHSPTGGMMPDERWRRRRKVYD